LVYAPSTYPIPRGRCEKIEIFPLSLPSPARRRGEIHGNSKRISLPLDGGGTGWGGKMDFFTPSGREGKYLEIQI
jgi:hypothetical protein